MPERPDFILIAEGAYGNALGVTTLDGLAASMADWARLSDAERGFALAHLLYLQLMAQEVLNDRILALEAALRRNELTEDDATEELDRLAVARSGQ